ncbi:glycosyltransferase [Pseudoalteromonas arabiensis]|uniref:glycosyltransferase n=1 Tax=Pseudoalteromonas arabiensis TaxID=874454 RepID=UPI0007839120|nr:glycosyltransferase [Pseudoalteromonas arabiensis]
MKKVAVLVLNEYINDSRVIKIVESLSHKYKVDVFALNNGDLEKSEKHTKNVNVLRKVSYSKPNSSLIKKAKQALVYLQYFFSTLFCLKNYDVVHCNDLETLPIGVFSKLFNRKLKVVYDAHEYETETLWMQNKYKKFLAKKLEGFLIRYADATSVVSDGIANEYVRLYNIEKPYLVLNTPKLVPHVKQDLFREKFGISQNKKIFLYQGGLTKGRGIEILLESFSKLEDTNHVIIFMGYGYLESEIKEYAVKYSNIFFHPAVTPDVLISFTSSADFGISFIEDLCLNYRYCLPNKIFEYVMAGIPVVCSNLVEMKSVVEEHQLGLVATGNDVNGFLKCINSVSSINYGSLVEKVAVAREVFNWGLQEKVIYKMYENL